MDNIEKAKKWFLNIMSNCYIKKLKKYPDRIFWIYDKTLERKRKIARINGNNDIHFNLSDGEIAFVVTAILAQDSFKARALNTNSILNLKGINIGEKIRN